MQDYSARVMAFEPQPYYADFVKKALRRVEVMECAVSDVEADAVLNVPVEVNDAGMAYIGSQTSLPADATRQIKVRSITIDSLKLSGIGFMKIDVEGHELAVLQGGERTIAREQPNLLIEAEERHRRNAVASINKFLQAYGYSGWFLSRGTLHPIAEFDPLLHQCPEALAFRSDNGKPPYINNFIFVQPTSMGALQDIVRRI
jgi:FkbM family methyltransferase